MLVIKTAPELRAALAGRRDVVVVPTMGNLHDGHLSLLQMAASRGGFVVATIFVNRLQFAPHEDFEDYPRTFKRDCELLDQGGCDLLFAPPEHEMYPEPQTCTVVPSPALAEILEGRSRPGFFTGVSTVVLKLFNMVQPAAAVFGKKDYQQLLVIRDLVRQMALPIEIIAAETVREVDGLARSSRNSYLNAAQRAHAGDLYRVLQGLVAAVRGGREDWPALERSAVTSLEAGGWTPDYVAVRTRNALSAPSPGRPLVALAAARLGPTRLLDNIEF